GRTTDIHRSWATWFCTRNENCPISAYPLPFPRGSLLAHAADHRFDRNSPLPPHSPESLRRSAPPWLRCRPELSTVPGSCRLSIRLPPQLFPIRPSSSRR